MDTKKFLNIPEISAGTKFWMIRTKDGYFFNEYIREGFIAIGWNLIRESSFPLTKSQDESFKNIIKEKYKNVQPGSSINKCYKFCCEIKTGDIAVIVGRTDIAFAKIGDYYEDDNPEFTIEKELEINKKIEDGVHASEVLCPYIKRRKIEIINLIKYSNDINPYFFKALAANRHSLSRADKHADIILSTCYDAYIYHNTLSIAFRVDKKDSINAIAFSHFISYFSNYLIGINKDSISIKTALNSPGDIVLQISDWLWGNGLAIIVAYFALFGGKIGSWEIPSVWNVIKYFIERHDKDEIQKVETLGKTLDNEMKKEEIRALRLKNDELEKLQHALPEMERVAQQLEIRMPKDNIIDLDAIKREISFRD